MERKLLNGIRFKAMEYAARLIQFLSPGKAGLLIKRISSTEDSILEKNHNSSRYGLVIQGPLDDAEKISDLLNYATKIVTSKAVNNIVISTWDNDFTKCLPEIDGITYVVSKDLNFDNNLQRQIYTSHVGISALPNFIKIAMKMRVDQRVSTSGIRTLFKYAESKDYEDRLIFMSMNSYIYRIFGLSDMLNVGKFSNMKLFWEYSVEMKPFNSSEKKIDLNINSWIDSNQIFWNESFLNISYAFKKGFRFSDNAWFDYMNYLKDWCSIVDSDFVGHKWLKINSPFESLTARSIYNDNIANEDIELSQTMWNAIFNDAYQPPFRRLNGDSL